MSVVVIGMTQAWCAKSTGENQQKTENLMKKDDTRRGGKSFWEDPKVLATYSIEALEEAVRPHGFVDSYTDSCDRGGITQESGPYAIN